MTPRVYVTAVSPFEAARDVSILPKQSFITSISDDIAALVVHTQAMCGTCLIKAITGFTV